jgi:predicted DNA-binding antitoxin AbrB/MazE fold protein
VQEPFAMTITIDAIYENGVLVPSGPLPLAEHDKVQVTVQTPIDVEPAVDAVQRGYGLLRWTGDRSVLDEIALDPEFGILDSP